MTGVMLAGTGIKGNLGSREYWPIYEEGRAAGLPRLRSMRATTSIWAWTA